MEVLRTWWMTRRFMRTEYGALPAGWISRFQARVLYRCGLLHDGPILEIGAWVGRSTCCLAAGVRDSGKPKKLVSIDLGFSSAEEWREFFGSSLSRKPNRDIYLREIEREGGTIAALRENLSKRGLARLVTVRKGDFRAMELGRFKLIFCDVTHSVREIEANGPRIRELLEPGGLLVADDIRNRDLLNALLQHIPCEHYSLRGSFFEGRRAA